MIHGIHRRQGENPSPQQHLLFLQEMIIFLTFVYPETDDGKTEKCTIHDTVSRNDHALLNDVKLLDIFKSGVKSKAQSSVVCEKKLCVSL